MSNRDRRKPPSRRRETAESRAFRRHLAEPEVDVEALARLGTPCGFVRIAGASVPILLPHVAPSDPSEFDALACAAGLACFVRPRVAGDDLDALIPASTAHMLVRGLAPGIRARMPIELLPEGSLN
jgi:hypothetical protein